VRLDVIERPLDDEPAQLAKLIAQVSLELMASLGSRLSPAEPHDEAADRRDDGNQANGQGEQGGGKVRCPEESRTRSIIHGGVLSREGTGFDTPCHFKREVPPFSSALRTDPANSSGVTSEKIPEIG
jgi:hypothetical protein